jgi:glycosyltransferase involved in cell wall biosynthesis
MPLSAVIITKNAATQIDACLASLAFADEVLVVDSDSSDGTPDLARSAGARVISKEWLGFGRQKQFAVSEARHDWVLCLDADERVSDALRSSLLAELAAPRTSAFEMARCNRFLGHWLRHGEGYPDWSLRLFDRREARWSDDAVHERVLANARPARLSGDLLHDSAETLEGYLDKQNRYTTLQADMMRAAGKRASLSRLVLSPLARFIKFYFFRLGFLDGQAGLVHITIGCMNSFNKYAKLLALQRQAS